MKKQILILFLFLFFCLPITTKAVVTNSSYSNIRVYFFYDDDCKECDAGREWLEKQLKDHNRFRVEYISIEENQEMIEEVRDALDIKKEKTPLIVLGSNFFLGFNEKIEKNLTEAMESYEDAKTHCDVVANIKSDQKIEDCLAQNEGIYEQPKEQNNLPIFLGVGFALFIILVILGVVFGKRKKLKK